MLIVVGTGTLIRALRELPVPTTIQILQWILNKDRIGET